MDEKGGFFIMESYMAPVAEPVCPRSEKMMGEKRGGDGENSEGGEAVLECACREAHQGYRESYG